ncbi:hypothetical protein [Streptomyces sp. SID3343]|uniref:hypothetical protein n=1 Tax=Streptomyces sp. SID3343 TaxID=2690260 RepID=UPI00136F4A81|nr:hypothetical protein [Streptomyces sp. SID3343]MYW05130.1 hypothetical protein [Streptomyces sp. SID3343]
MSSRPDTRPTGCLLWLARFVLAVIAPAVVTVFGGLYACQRQFAAADKRQKAYEKHHAEETRARLDTEVPFRVFHGRAGEQFKRLGFARCWRDTTTRPKPQAGMVGVICTSTTMYLYGSDDPTTSTADFVREARRLGLTPDTGIWERPQPVSDVRFPDPTPPRGAGEQFDTPWVEGLYANPVAWQQAYTKHQFVIRASVTAQYRTERNKPKPTPRPTPMFPRSSATCAGAHRPWSCL